MIVTGIPQILLERVPKFIIYFYLRPVKVYFVYDNMAQLTLGFNIHKTCFGLKNMFSLKRNNFDKFKGDQHYQIIHFKTYRFLHIAEL